MITVRRTGALGDVLMATPIVRRLRNLHKEVNVQTAYKDVFKGWSNVSVSDPHQPMGVGDELIDLDLAYESLPSMHVVEAYAQKAFGGPMPGINNHMELVFNNAPILEGGRYVAVHAARAGWANRTLPTGTWRLIIDGLRRAGFDPILIGSERDNIPRLDITRLLVNDIHLHARLINSCCCFIGSDSSLLHVAGCTDTPIVCAFTSVHPVYRLPYRGGVIGYRCKAVLPRDLDCLGCQERATPPTITESCERGDVACVGMVHPDDMVQAVIDLTEGWF